MKLVLFRVDGSHQLGMGHIMRCLALAQGLEKTGVKPVFIIRDYESKTFELIRRNGYDVDTISQDASVPEDASLTSKFASQYGARLILTDLSNTDSLANLDKQGEYFETLKAAGKFLVTIDGFGEDGISARVPIPCDIVIIPYYGAKNRHYKFYNSTKSLLGPSYCIFRREFVEAAKVSRVIMRDARNILVSLGGSDPRNLTIKVARALNRLNVNSVNLRIVIGPGFAPLTRQELGIILKGFRGKYELALGSNNMAELMLWSDLAIIGGGLTKYETALTGTPNIIISHSEQEAEAAREFERSGAALYLGLASEIGEENIVETAERLLKDYTLRREMAKKGQNLVDGKGIERIIGEIPKGVL